MAKKLGLTHNPRLSGLQQTTKERQQTRLRAKKSPLEDTRGEIGSSVTLVASQRGFEPPACRLGGGRSILLSYSDI